MGYLIPFSDLLSDLPDAPTKLFQFILYIPLYELATKEN